MSLCICPRRYESGADAAVNLAKAGKQCTVLASTATWNVQTPDPSTELAPYTAQRLREVTAAGFSPRPKLLAPLRVLRVERAAVEGFNVIAVRKADEHHHHTRLRSPLVIQAEDSTTCTPGDTCPSGDDCANAHEGSELTVHTSQPPVLCTGFKGSVASAASHLFNLADESDEAKGCLTGAPLLTVDDESTKVPGVFLVGPTVRHGELSFCFVYKFRQRFGVVANAICCGLGRDTKSAVESCRKMNMYLDDVKCCESRCGDAC
jgi:putative flavoprotein involved in K+ transport